MAIHCFGFSVEKLEGETAPLSENLSLNLRNYRNLGVKIATGTDYVGTAIRNVVLYSNSHFGIHTKLRLTEKGKR